MAFQSLQLAGSCRTWRLVASITAFELLPAIAFAHPGHTAAGFSAGFMHPLTGWDHVAAMLAIGLWSTQLGGMARITLPAVFLLAMLAGALLAGPWLPASFIEAVILSSVVASAALVIRGARPLGWMACLMVGCFAVFHGMAHSVDSVAPLSAGYLYGMLLVSAGLLAVGIGFGMSLKRVRLLG
jgi:urease accessory protein